MSTYNGRRAPNVSHLLQDLATQDAPAVDDNFNMEDDLELFTNTQFYDFDSGQQTDFQVQPQPVKVATGNARTNTEDVNSSATASTIGEMPNLDFSMAGESRAQVLSTALLFNFGTSHFASPHTCLRQGRASYLVRCLATLTTDSPFKRGALPPHGSFTHSAPSGNTLH